MKTHFKKILILIGGVMLIGCNKPQQNKPEAEIKKDSSQVIAKDTTVEKLPLDTLEQSLVEQGLVNIQEVDTTLLVELKYSTTDNFVGKDVYGNLTNCYLQPYVAQMLEQAHQYLKAQHPELRLLIYDGVRPLRVQYILWNSLDKPYKDRIKYVADPEKGSIHNYGSAIDLTIADAQGNPLDMGTPYDYFGELAYPVREDDMIDQGRLTRQQVENRLILRSVMQKAGFSTITSEWWHFNAYSRSQAQEQFKIVE